MRLLADTADAVLEATVAGSFTRLGLAVRRRLEYWPALSDLAAQSGFAGSRVVLTGATSGIGAATAEHLVGLGAEVHIIGRDPARTAAAVQRLNGAGLAGSAVAHIADLNDLRRVADLCDSFASEYDRLDVLIHNAGALTHEYAAAPGGHEQTYTAQVLAPHLMTHRLLPLLPPDARVVMVSSGGMYAEPLRPGAMEAGPDGYDGVRAYARAKRCQVELVAQWARRHTDTGVLFAAMHPGWADTPGVRTSLPKFHRITRLALRDAAQGADTVVWLAVAALPPGASGLFWHDRRPRRTSLLPGSATDPRDAEALWEQVEREAYSALARYESRDQNSSRLSTT